MHEKANRGSNQKTAPALEHTVAQAIVQNLADKVPYQAMILRPRGISALNPTDPLHPVFANAE